jgi:phosphate binding protein
VGLGVSGSRWNTRQPKGCFVTKDAETCNSLKSIWERDCEPSGGTLIPEALSLTIRAWESVGELGLAVCHPIFLISEVYGIPNIRGTIVKLRIVLTGTVLLSFACGGGNGAGDRTVIQNKGSDTLVNVAQSWAEAYGQVHPAVAVAVTGGGSGTGFSALLNGTVDIANASRQIRDSEIESARGNGFEPVEFIVGYDALAVFLHPNNPISEFTFGQLASIYGEGGPFESWSDLGVTVPGCSSGEIVRVSRQNNSGTYAYFQETVLGEADFKLGSRDMNGSSEVVDLVENTPCAIGYSGLAYATDHV